MPQRADAYLSECARHFRHKAGVMCTVSRRPTSQACGALAERFLQFGDEIVDRFDADGQPHEAIADAEFRAHGRGQRRMRHQRGMLDEAFHATETFREREQMAALEEATRIL